MHREELSELPVGTFPCFFKGEPALLVKEPDKFVYLKHNRDYYRGSGINIKPFKYSWCIYSPQYSKVHEPMNLSEIVLNNSNMPLGEL